MATLGKWLNRLLTATAALLLIAMIAVVAILDSNAGTRWVIDQLARRVPGELRIEELSGTLWAGLHVAQVAYEDAGREVTASEMRVSIDWSRTSLSRLVLGDVTSSTAAYRSLGPPNAEPKPLTVMMRPSPLDIEISHSAIGELRITRSERETLLRNLALSSLRLDGNRIAAAAVSMSHDAGSLSAENISTKLDGDVPVSGKIAWQDSVERWSGNALIGGTLARLEFEHELFGPFPAAAAGSIELLHRLEPRVDATVQWASWRFGGYQATAGRVDIRGFVPHYDADFDFRLTDPDDRSAQLAGTAQGDGSGLSELQVTADTPAGTVHAQGSMRWTPSFAASFRLLGEELDFSQLAPVPETAIDTDLSLELRSQRDFSLTIDSIDGSYNNERFRGRGQVTRSDDRWRCQECNWRVGANTATVQGSMNDGALSVGLSIDAPAVNQLWPEYRGAVEIDGAIGGTLSAPVFTGTATGNSLALFDWIAERFSISSRASTVDRLDLSASIDGLQKGEFILGNFEISLQGAPASLDSRIDWVLSSYSGDVRGILELNAEFPKALVRDARFHHEKTGSWQLASPFRISRDQEQISFAAHTWRNGEASLILEELRIAEGGTRIVGSLNQLPLGIFEYWMPENFDLAGHADSDVDLRISGKELYGTVSWNQQQTRLRVSPRGDEPVDIIIPVAKIDARLLGDSADAAAAIQIDPGLRAQLQLTLAGFDTSALLDAKLTMDGEDWYWVPAVIPQIDKIDGRISASIVARGPYLTPDLDGELRWIGGSLMIPALNMPVSDIDLVVAGTSTGNATASGSARAGDGSLGIDGRFENLMRDDRSFSLHLSGENAQILDWPEYKLSASPDLNMHGTLDKVTVTGRISVPFAEIIVKRIPEEAVRPSADVTVVGRAAETEKKVRVTGRADIVLGDNVHVQALGLDTKLIGQVRASVAENGSQRAEGELTLKDGVFEAYGQRLTITEGSMLFTGPLDDPFVNVRAVRKIESINGTIIAGLHLRGPAQNIVATVFSDPAMAESDALSYLVLGRPLAQATSSEGGELSGAAVALGLRQAGRITNQIGQAFGLDQLEVTGDGSSTTALVAGKQVSSRLYVRYAYGVFSQLGAVLLRYRLSRRLTLETSTGETQSMDLLYIVEKP